MIKFNPSTLQKINNFKKIKRGYFSFIILTILIICSLFSEILINSRAMVVSYEGDLFFPTYGKVLSGKTFGLDYDYETNYRDLKKKFEGTENWVLMPIVPYNEYENDLVEGVYPPSAPSVAQGHYLGTDSTGRDILARLAYGFRIAIFFSLLLLIFNYLIGITMGCLMGYLGGRFDMIMQRLIEIWSNVPFLYIVIIISSIMIPSFFSLVLIMVMFGWMGMAWYMRSSTYKERAREYVIGAKAAGAGHTRIIFHHIIPNSLSLIITFIPFSVSGGITALTSLDYLGFGLPAPTPSWGELLKQGTDNMEAYWISLSVVSALVVILTMVTFIGEAIREAFDPKKHILYK